MQGHLDMVCEKTPESDHDFDTDPIPAYVDGDLVRSKGTTLGADNGVDATVADGRGVRTLDVLSIADQAPDGEVFQEVIVNPPEDVCFALRPQPLGDGEGTDEVDVSSK